MVALGEEAVSDERGTPILLYGRCLKAAATRDVEQLIISRRQVSTGQTPATVRIVLLDVRVLEAAD